MLKSDAKVAATIIFAATINSAPTVHLKMDREITVNQQAMKAKNQQKSGSLEEYLIDCMS